MSGLNNVSGPIYATEVGDFTASMSEDHLWEPIEGADAKWARFVFGDRDDQDAPQAWLIKMGPNFRVTRHHHDAHRFEMLLEGSYSIGGAERGPGTVTFFPGGVPYGPVTFGPEGGTMLEVFSKTSGLAPVFAELPNSETVEQLVAIFGTLGTSPAANSKA